MSDQTRSLLDHIDSPILVGDPDGRTVYVNPSFESCFGVTSDSTRGQPLAALFEGGAREAVLRAVAEVCGGSGTARFPLREAGRGFQSTASPISVEGGRVGVIILLTEEREGHDRILAASRAAAEPFDDLARCLSELEGAGSDRQILDDALRALEELRKHTDEITAVLTAGS
jgi:PAS domain S-box-containing protein